MPVVQSSLLGFLLALFNFFAGLGVKNKNTINLCVDAPQPQITFVMTFCHCFSMAAKLWWALGIFSATISCFWGDEHHLFLDSGYAGVGLVILWLSFLLFWSWYFLQSKCCHARSKTNYMCVLILPPQVTSVVTFSNHFSRAATLGLAWLIFYFMLHCFLADMPPLWCQVDSWLLFICPWRAFRNPAHLFLTFFSGQFFPGNCSPASSKPKLTINLCVDKLSFVVTFHSHAGMGSVFLIVANHYKLPTAAMLGWASWLLFFV